MLLLTTLADMKAWITARRKEGKKIGLVPTMGYLHQGHMALVTSAKRDCDAVVLSIFVNPLQFGQGEDYEVYPRDLKRDSQLAQEAGVDVIFAPTVPEMYPRGKQKTFVEVEKLTERLCGASRPGHFRGVTTVVTKLFNIITPDYAYFGQKDAQQVAVIRRMAEDLNMNVQIEVLPIVREADGLALSSRNVYLLGTERESARVLYQALEKAQQEIAQGEKDASMLLKVMTRMIEQCDKAKIDYIEIVDAFTMEPIQKLEGSCLIAMAVYIGKTRLIDNVLVEV
ncbi:pantoate--beta-alanine ligase [Heliorestis acidaminivorans]|uniref:Pantothenate synthetase n=1 Tax=Heliorestis acidaminivorans TaxID=553427 RepID=A0A6I0EUT6_9FIRM|nr:pantoate--beta-alanine ligase [Heliorestis acidaminivorans]KAB2953083.1 pantoate--beta-alanine ligase [Heliorestis acidaminivorans]